MITPAFTQLMAQYNRWQNQSIFGAASTLDDAARRLDRGAFFGSIHKTLSHLLWGDTIWMSRFDGGDAPSSAITDSTEYAPDWTDFCAARINMDTRIIDWAAGVVPDDFLGDLTWYSGAIGREISKPRAMLVMQIFNHQTHHRGQVHAMLTAAGARPDDTDLPFMPAGENDV